MAKREFTMNGKSYNTLTAIAAELGVKRVYTRDFAKYGITEVTAADTPVAISKSVNILSDDTADATDTQNDATIDANAVEALVQDAQNQAAVDLGIDPTDLIGVVDDVADVDDTPQTDDEVQSDTPQTDDADDNTAVDNPLTTGGSAIIFAHATADGIAVDKVIDIGNKVADDKGQDDNADESQTDEQDVPVADTSDTAPEANTADDAVESQTDNADEPQTDDATDNTADATDTQAADVSKPAPAKKLTEDELIAQIERDVVDYADATELSQNLRKVSLKGLIKMAENVQVDTWERMANAGIRKMRVIMELKKAYFPTQPTRTTVSTGPSPWKKIPTADLQAVATAKGCVWKDCANEGILRMRLIMVLKAVGVTADEFKK